MRTGLPPVRNADKGKKKIQVGASDVEKQKAEERKDSAPKGPSSKQQKYYSYDYFKEWDKFDVDVDGVGIAKDPNNVGVRQLCPKCRMEPARREQGIILLFVDQVVM